MRTARFSRLALGNGGPRLGAGAPRERCIYARSLRTMEEKPSASSPGQTVVEERAAAGATTSPVSSTPPTAAPTRLFSNLNATTLQHEPGSFLGATALVAGTTVGAGILALPSVAASSGFVPSSAALVTCCFASIATGLLIAEVCLATMCELGSGGVGLQSAVSRTLGPTGTAAFSSAYLFLHYCLLVAYISKGGEILTDAGVPLGEAGAALVYAVAIGALCYKGSPRTVDAVNGALVVGTLAAFAGLLALTLPGIDPKSLTMGGDWGRVPDALPTIALAYVYHNVVPVLATSLEGDRNKIRGAIVLGSLLPLAMFLLWDAAVLGTPIDFTSASALDPSDPASAIASRSPLASSLVASFSFLALTTSFIGFVIGLSDFLANALGKPSGRPAPMPYLLTLAPPFVLSLALKDVFLTALDRAGTYGVLTLFGLLPPAMAWQQRYGSQNANTPNMDSNDAQAVTAPLVPGGRPVLLALGAGSAGIIAREAAQATGLLQ